MKIKVFRDSRFVRLNKAELDMIVGALDKLERDAVNVGVNVTTAHEFRTQAAWVGRMTAIRDRLSRFEQSL